MKKVFLACFLAFASAGAVSAQTVQTTETKAANPAKAPKFKFAEEVHDFGSVKEGPQAEHVFAFKNTGKSPLIIQNVSASCGCTTPEWSKEPIAPGKSGKITVRYNTQGRVGPIDKAVYIQSNALLPEGKGDRYELKIKGTVVPAN
ncbi:MAG: DUF1573 domain-containing protein [Sphingobacteriales bacterium]|nr:MAG: DUF1573 domain-containing protein [Sphingobacteriales bacterium]